MTSNAAVALILRVLAKSITLLAVYVIVVENRSIMSVQCCLPSVAVLRFWYKPTHPAARSLCDSWASCNNSQSFLPPQSGPQIQLSQSSVVRGGASAAKAPCVHFNPAGNVSGGMVVTILVLVVKPNATLIWQDYTAPIFFCILTILATRIDRDLSKKNIKYM